MENLAAESLSINENSVNDDIRVDASSLHNQNSNFSTSLRQHQQNEHPDSPFGRSGSSGSSGDGMETVSGSQSAIRSHSPVNTNTNTNTNSSEPGNNTHSYIDGSISPIRSQSPSPSPAPGYGQNNIHSPVTTTSGGDIDYTTPSLAASPIRDISYTDTNSGYSGSTHDRSSPVPIYSDDTSHTDNGGEGDRNLSDESIHLEQEKTLQSMHGDSITEGNSPDNLNTNLSDTNTLIEQTSPQEHAPQILKVPSPALIETEKVLMRVVALFDFESDEPGDLTFEVLL